MHKEEKCRKLIINGLRSRSGGSIVHLKYLLEYLDSNPHEYAEVILIANKNLLSTIPKYKWLVYVQHPFIDNSLITNLVFEIFLFKKLLAKHEKNSVLLNLDGNYLGPFMIPTVTMSRDMLSFEPGLLALYFPSKFWLRNLIIRLTQIRAFNKSNGVIFLTNYAARTISISAKRIKNSTVISHGFDHDRVDAKQNYDLSDEASLIYVSPIWKFKDHEVILRALKILKDNNQKFRMNFIGSYTDELREFQKLKSLVNKFDLASVVNFVGAVSHSEVLAELKKSDVFVFASRCENMPNALIEAMGLGLPIVSSDAGPMPEVLQGAGMLYTRSDPSDLHDALLKIMKDNVLRCQLGQTAITVSKNYSWCNTMQKTLCYLNQF